MLIFERLTKENNETSYSKRNIFGGKIKINKRKIFLGVQKFRVKIKRLIITWAILNKRGKQIKKCLTMFLGISYPD